MEKMILSGVFSLLVSYSSLVFSHPTAIPGTLSGRYELFLEKPYYVGLPTLGGEVNAIPDFVKLNGLQQEYHIESIAITGSGSLGGGSDSDDDSASGDQWPGRHDSVNLTNTGADVVKVFRENLKTRVENNQEGMSQSDTVQNKANTCKEKEECQGAESNYRGGMCVLDCMLEEQQEMKDIISPLFNGIVSYCHALDTLYTRLNEAGIYTLERFLQFSVRVENPILEVTLNIPFRSLLTRLIREVKTPLMPLRKLLSAFQDELDKLKVGAGSKDGIIIADNPECSRISIMDAVVTAVDIIAKNPSLTDYLVFQGYALTDAMSKYVDEFPTKKNFYAQHFVYDMMLGTTCGLVLYGQKYETTDCDQYGGYPVIDTPVPVYMWKDEDQEVCEAVREQLVLKGEGSGSGSGAPGKGKRKRQVSRSGKGKSLKIGKK